MGVSHQEVLLLRGMLGRLYQNLPGAFSICFTPPCAAKAILVSLLTHCKIREIAKKAKETGKKTVQRCSDKRKETSPGKETLKKRRKRPHRAMPSRPLVMTLFPPLLPLGEMKDV